MSFRVLHGNDVGTARFDRARRDVLVGIPPTMAVAIATTLFRNYAFEQLL